MPENADLAATVRERAHILRDYATHFAPRDWDYTREHGIKRIVYKDETARGGYDHWRNRLKRAAREIVRRRNKPLDRFLPVNRWYMARVHLRGDSNCPDGILDGGNVVTHWEETGEYLQMVQPSVGALLADLMDAHPELPEVQAISTELGRIADRYRERCRIPPVATEEADRG